MAGHLAAVSVPVWRRRSVQVAFFALLLFIDLRIVLLSRQQPLGLDFLPLWTAARLDPHRIYDFAAVTEAQSWLFSQKPRPFVYPPSALPLLAPFGLLSFHAAYAAFVTLTGGLYFWAAKRLSGERWLPLMPPVVLVAVAGQVSLLIGGLIAMALTLPRRPVIAGVLFGLAGAVKPQALVLLPLALLVERNWRAMLSAGATVMLMAAAGMAMGANWSEWLAALPRFQQLVASDPALLDAAATPYALFGPVGLIAMAPLAIGAVALAFRRPSVPVRLAALVAGSLMISPYAMSYEFAQIVPAVLASGGLIGWLVIFGLSVGGFQKMGALALFAAAAFVGWSLRDAVGLRFGRGPGHAGKRLQVGPG